MADRTLLYRREFLRRSALAAASVAVVACTPQGVTTASPTVRPSASPVRGGTLTFGQWDTDVSELFKSGYTMRRQVESH